MHKLKDLLINYLSGSYHELRQIIARQSPARNLALAPHMTPQRRRMLKGLAATAIVLTGGRLLFRDNNGAIKDDVIQSQPDQGLVLNEANVTPESGADHTRSADIDKPITTEDESVKDYLYKMRNFNSGHNDDRFLDADELALLGKATKHLRRAQNMIGHANFNLLSFDDLLYYARNYSQIGAFSRDEQEMMDRFFYTDARELGFYGDKVTDKLTLDINKRDTIKVAGSGNYLFKGKPEQLLRKIQQQGGSNVILTSGIRGIVKQMHLFMEKTIASDGNLSLASRSLAPPGYSFHGISDFDVGQRGLGYKNFTADFASSDVYKKLSDLGFLTMRYPLDNMLGVRYEPWHVKVG